MSSANDTALVICRMSDLPDPGARAFTMGSGIWPLRGFVARKGQEVFAYLNRCPHAGHPLNLFANDFLSLDQSLLMCRSHGACFEIATGVCVAGPCVGAQLRPIAVKVEHELIVLIDDPNALAAKFG